ncbi:MAG: hypothetical protein DRR08_28935 [Candidatus Parabeggiatoa sp. nov. 2]|nr:MAG: hypothetical protein B6247_27760 [Beggiatoa sp. 4572_84]RKZ51758.1 MAG: hypothetical protein DRR08_28935 [Gammaproteobacteria bacterium]HEC85734.1 hypothetical protein [Thioploca sp.]
MTDIIETTVINSQFEMPERHLKFTDTGITKAFSLLGRPINYILESKPIAKILDFSITTVT